MELDTSEIGAERYEQRPWGTYTILDESDSFKVKRIEVFP